MSDEDDYYARQQKRGEDGAWLLLKVALWVAIFAVAFHWGLAFCH